MVAVTGAMAATSPIPRGDRVASAHAIHVIVPIPSPATTLVARSSGKVLARAEAAVASAIRPSDP